MWIWTDEQVNRSPEIVEEDERSRGHYSILVEELVCKLPEFPGDVHFSFPQNISGYFSPRPLFAGRPDVPTNNMPRNCIIISYLFERESNRLNQGSGTNYSERTI
jgi:hypothetical protein